MANSPLLTMPILNGVPMWDPADQATPANIFGNLTIGTKIPVLQSVPSDLVFLGAYSACTGNVYYCPSVYYLSLQRLDFYSIANPSIKSVITLPGLVQDNGSNTKRSGLLITPSGLKAEYWKSLPEVTPTYGEAYPNYNKWIEFYQNVWSKKLYIWWIVYKRLNTISLSNLVLLYSRYQTEKIRQYLLLKQTKYPVRAEGHPADYFYGISEGLNMVPTFWGAKQENPLSPLCAIQSLDIILYFMYKENVIRSVSDVDQLFRELKNHSLTPGTTFNPQNQTGILLYSTKNLDSPPDSTYPLLRRYYNTILNYYYKYSWLYICFTQNGTNQFETGAMVTGCFKNISPDNKITTVIYEYVNLLCILQNILNPQEDWWADYNEIWAQLANGWIPPGV